LTPDDEFVSFCFGRSGCLSGQFRSFQLIAAHRIGGIMHRLRTFISGAAPARSEVQPFDLIRRTSPLSIFKSLKVSPARRASSALATDAADSTPADPVVCQR
jgi:hypothetical protein